MEEKKFPNPTKYSSRDQEEFDYLKNAASKFYDHVDIVFEDGDNKSSYLIFGKNLQDNWEGNTIVEITPEEIPIRNIISKDIECLINISFDKNSVGIKDIGGLAFLIYKNPKEFKKE